MAEVGIDAARAALSRLVERALAGEEIIITRRGQPVVRLTPLDGRTTKPRRPGALKGLFTVPDTFLEPLSEDELAEFYDGPIVPDDGSKGAGGSGGEGTEPG